MSNGERRFERRDWIMVALFFAVGVLLRIPFRSQMAYHWDSAQFTLAIQMFDMRLSQPHAPGYFLYVILGRLVNNFVGDPHASLVWISVVFSGALPSIVYLLATAMFDRWAGAAAGLVALTSPQVWFHGCVALSYIVDSFLVCLVVLVLWRAMEQGGSWGYVLIIGALLAVIGGIREQSVAVLLPLVGFTFWRFQHNRLAKLVLAAVLTIGLGALWFAPMMRTSGGLETYLTIARLQASFNAPETLWGGGVDAFVRNVAYVAVFSWNGLVFGAVILVCALLHRAFRMSPDRKRAWDDQHALARGVLAVWILPMMLLWTVGVTRQPGHVLSYLPGWFVVIGAVIAQLSRGWFRSTVVVVICALNIVAFIAWPSSWDAVFFGMGRTAREIQSHDARLRQLVNTTRRLCKSSEVVVCHAAEPYLYGLKHFQLYLPEYDQYQLVTDPTVPHPADKPMWRCHNGLLESVSGLDLRDKKEIVLFVPPGENLDIYKSYFYLGRAKSLTEGANNFYGLPIEAVKRGGEDHLN
jgi:hypothetical protein